MRRAGLDTVAAIDAAYREEKSWRAVAAKVGVNHATLRYVSAGNYCSSEMEKRIRSGLGLPEHRRSYTPRPVTTKEQERRRAALGAQWRDVIEAGLAAMEMDKKHTVMFDGEEMSR